MCPSTITTLVHAHLRQAHSEARPLDRKQKRLKGRVAIVPNLDWSQYRLRSGFDTIIVKCHFTNNMHPASLHSALEKSLNRKIGRILQLVVIEGREQLCLVTLQKPSINDLKALEALSYVRGSIEIEQLDIAIDFHPSRSMHDEARSYVCKAAADTLARYVAVDPAWSPRGCNPRWTIGSPVNKSNETYTTVGRAAFNNAPNIKMPDHVQGTFHLTHAKEPIEYRIYHKTKDGIGGKDERDIPPRDQIARYEFVLYRKALEHYGLNSVADLQSFQFKTLMTFATFRAPTVKQWANNETLVRRRVSQRLATSTVMRLLYGGLSLVQEGYRSSSEGKWGQTIAIPDLNKRMGMALVRLTDKVKNGGGGSLV